MTAMSKAECLRKGIEWTAEREKKYCAELLKQKKRLIKEFYLPFPKEIEVKFYDAVNQGRDYEVCLDNLCLDYIKRALDDTPKTMLELLLSSTKDNILTQKEIIDILGNYGYGELRKSGLIKRVGSSMVIAYQIR